MSRMIDADAIVLERALYTHQEIKMLINNQPIVFDKEKVIKELESMETEYSNDFITYGKNIGLYEARKVVERGGIE